jgi:hypothetical protein
MGPDYFSNNQRGGGRLESSFRGDLNQVDLPDKTLPHLSYDKSFTDLNYTSVAEKNKRPEREVLETKFRVRVKVSERSPVKRSRGTLPPTIV